jgi:hypothetical protein
MSRALHKAGRKAVGQAPATPLDIDNGPIYCHDVLPLIRQASPGSSGARIVGCLDYRMPGLSNAETWLIKCTAAGIPGDTAEFDPVPDRPSNTTSSFS